MLHALSPRRLGALCGRPEFPAAAGSALLVDAMCALVLLQAAKAFLVAAHTAVDFLALTGGHLVGPCRVSQQLAAHGGAGNAAGGELLLHKVGATQAADAGDGLVGVAAHLITEFQEAALVLEIGVVARGNRVLQAGMVRQRHMEAGDTGLHKHRHKDAERGLDHTGVAVVGVLLPDSQLVIDRQLGQAAAHGLHGLYGKAGAVLGTAAVLVGAVVANNTSACREVLSHSRRGKPPTEGQKNPQHF